MSALVMAPLYIGPSVGKKPFLFGSYWTKGRLQTSLGHQMDFTRHLNKLRTFMKRLYYAS